MFEPRHRMPDELIERFRGDLHFPAAPIGDEAIDEHLPRVPNIDPIERFA